MNALRKTLESAAVLLITIAAIWSVTSHLAWANEIGLPHDMVKIVGQEDFVYVWTLGVEGLGDDQDKLVTVDVNPHSNRYGKVVHSVSVGGRNEAHHMGFTFDRRYLWGARPDTSKIFVFDIRSDPSKPKLIRTITDFVAKSGGVVGTHTVMPMKDRMIVTGLSNNRDPGGRSALVEYSADGDYIATYWMPTDENLQRAEKTGKYADGYNYDVRAIPRLNAMFTSSFTGWSNNMMDFGKMLKDEEAMKRFGNTFVVWNLSERKPLKIFDMPGAPLEIRCAIDPNHDYAFTATALTSKIWLIYMDDRGVWQAKEVADIGYEWDGKELKEHFTIDFTKEKLGRPHEMKFSVYSLYG